MHPSLQSTLGDTIVDALRSDGCYVGEIEPLSTQRLVDAQWAAHRAARAVGTRVNVAIREERAPGKPARAVLHVTPWSPQRISAKTGCWS